MAKQGRLKQLVLLVACLADLKETPMLALAIAALLVVVGIVSLFVREISRSPNAKVVIIGSGESGLPVILNTN